MKTCGVCLKSFPDSELSGRKLKLRLVDVNGNTHVITCCICLDCAWKEDPRKGKVWNR